MRGLIVGIGSAFGDDTLGWRLLDALTLLDWRRNDWTVELVKADRPGLALLELMQGWERVVLLDALESGGQPGAVLALDRNRLALNDARFSSHALGVAEVLALGETLGQLPAHLLLLGIVVGGAPDQATIRRTAAQIKAFFQGAGSGTR